MPRCSCRHCDLQQAGEVVGGDCDFAVEVGADAVHGERADDQRERAQDHERQQRRDARQARADRQAVERRRDAREQLPQRDAGRTSAAQARRT